MMNKEENGYSFYAAAEEDTERFARALAQIARPGDTFALFGTLGMGKSVLSRAFIRFLTAAAEVPSPTFTLLQTYEAPNFEICHFDLYRLRNQEEVFEIGMEDALYGSVCLIEWPERMGDYLPRDIFKIRITPQGKGRQIKIEAFSPVRQQRLAQLAEMLND